VEKKICWFWLLVCNHWPRKWLLFTSYWAMYSYIMARKSYERIRKLGTFCKCTGKWGSGQKRVIWLQSWAFSSGFIENCCLLDLDIVLSPCPRLLHLWLRYSFVPLPPASTPLTFSWIFTVLAGWNKSEGRYVASLGHIIFLANQSNYSMPRASRRNSKY
jgi:hypothetical protein